MYDFLTICFLHYIFMWLFGYDLLLTCRIASIDSTFSYLSISWIDSVLWFFHLFFLIGAQVPYGFGLSY